MSEINFIFKKSSNYFILYFFAIKKRKVEEMQQRALGCGRNPAYGPIPVFLLLLISLFFLLWLNITSNETLESKLNDWIT